MDERYYLLNAVIEASNRDTIRLVFADWLDENGECGESMRWAWRKGKRPFSIRVNNRSFWFADELAMNLRKADYYIDFKICHSLLPRLFCDPKTSTPDGYTGFTFLNLDGTVSTLEIEHKTEQDSWNWFIKRFGELHNQGRIGYSRVSKKKLAGQEEKINDTHKTD